MRTVEVPHIWDAGARRCYYALNNIKREQCPLSQIDISSMVLIIDEASGARRLSAISIPCATTCWTLAQRDSVDSTADSDPLLLPLQVCHVRGDLRTLGSQVPIAATSTATGILFTQAISQFYLPSSFMQLSAACVEDRSTLDYPPSTII